MPGHSPYTLSSLTITLALLLTHMVFLRPIQLSKNEREEAIFTRLSRVSVGGAGRN
jgi:hypothetical protein